MIQVGSNLRVVGGSVDEEQLEHVGEHVGGVEADEAVREVLVAALHDDLVAVVEAVLGVAQLVLVAAEQRAHERVRHGLGDGPGGQHAAEAQRGAQQGGAEHLDGGPDDPVGRVRVAGHHVAQLVVGPRAREDARAHAHYHRRVPSATEIHFVQSLRK